MTDFLGLGMIAVIACAIAMIAGGTVKGVVGIGLPLVALPVMATFIPIPKAIALLLLPSFVTSVWQTFQGGLFTAIGEEILATPSGHGDHDADQRPHACDLRR